MLKYSLTCLLFFLYVSYNAAETTDGSRQPKRENRQQTNITSNSLPAEQIICYLFRFCGYRGRQFEQNPILKIVFQWKMLNFKYPTMSDLERDINNKTFIPGIPTPIDVDVYYRVNRKRTVFITIPRFQAGIPLTLGTVTKSKSTRKTTIKPYPNWEWHRNPEQCRKNRLVSVYRVKVDKCNRLWVLDTGRLSKTKVCPMQILAFDLETNELVHRHTIPESLIKPISILVTPIVEVRNGCSDTYIYIADCQSHSIIVHELKTEASWRVSDKTMYPQAAHSRFKIKDDQFNLMDGVLGMDLGPEIPGEDRKLYYHALSSITENWVSTDVLRNQSLFKQYPGEFSELFHAYNGTRQSQSAAQAIDKNGIAFFGQVRETTINCWDTTTEYGTDNIDVVAYNPITLQFPTGVKVVDNPKGYQELWVLTSRLQKVLTGKLNLNETNFRIQVFNLDYIVRGKKCQRKK